MTTELHSSIEENPNYVALIDNENNIITASKSFCSDICAVAAGCKNGKICERFASLASDENAANRIKFEDLFLEADAEIFLETQKNKSSDHRKQPYRLKDKSNVVAFVSMIKVPSLNTNSSQKIKAISIAGKLRQNT